MSFRESFSVTLRDGSHAEIFYGTAATHELKSQPEALKDMIAQEVAATHEIPNLLFTGTRMYIRGLLLPVAERIGRLSSTIPKRLCTQFLNLLYPPGWFFSPTIQEELDWGWIDTQKQMATDNFAIAKVGEEIVALSAYKLGGEFSDNRNVFEITKSITLPEARGKGLNTLLREQIIQVINDRHPYALIMSMSKNKTVITRCKKLGWLEISLEEYSKITQRINRSGISADAISVFRHWKCFLYDPKQHQK